MVPSSADIVLQNRRISQSETSHLNICDVVNTMAAARPGANVLGTRVLEYIFEVLVLVLVEIIDHVLVLVVHVLIFYEYFTSTSEYSYHVWLI